MKMLLYGLCLVLLSGCATRGPLAFDCPGFAGKTQAPMMTQLEKEIHSTTASGSPQLLSFEPAKIPAQLFNPMQVSASHQLVPSPQPKPPAGILLLSGGGQWGAYGASFLSTLRATGKLPEFPVVTGVSTGAMQALYVGVGDDQAYEALIRGYTPVSEGDIVNRNPAPLALITGSFAGLKPLSRLLEKEVCQDPMRDRGCLMDRIAALKDKRAILIGFVDAQSGQFRYIDAVELAQLPDRRRARNCIVGAALASAAMPVTFQQVQVDHKTYYDGGVRLSAFEAGVAAEAELAAKRFLSTLSPDRLPQTGFVPLYVLRNGPTIVPEAEAKSSPDTHGNALIAALRAEAIAVNQLEVQSIASLRLAHPNGAIYLTTANNSGCDKPSGSMFNPDFMRCLREVGARKAASTSPWKELPPLTTELRAP